MEKIKKQNNFCDIQNKKNLSKNKIIRFKNNQWNTIKSIPYKDKSGNWALIERFPLIASNAIKFEVRYFEIAQGGCSSLEYHKHAHVVICLKGKGKIRLGNKYKVLKYLDIAYIAPNEIHQLLNPYKEPFGFLCIVDKERDKPVEIKD
ncbi:MULTISPECIES: cupin domain-containing protein [Thermodesulfovibrio]|uniref:Cupin domain protein n=1 Tax=Thermodesulfovibrio yellowstonii (strain ATCC 51303 / DSM 11347 / YP87) TaxID=289376 RepID=B5YKT6_THEYD|nr:MULTISPECIES: cupin domain-containing protein [Thermodesulfovibrio]ACI22064.1 cupin domain protein [Thermodesulfovibrio yellowstonii DSM 11347]MDI6864208.1 cupin domain-containing protein [Thermodesulfovibrio yellowstonii]